MKLAYCILFLLLFSKVTAQNWEQKMLQGIKAYRSNQLNKAQRAFEEAYQLSDTSVAAAYNLANTLYQQGNASEALSLYQNLLKNNQLAKPTMAIVQYNTGVALAKLRQWSSAVAAFKQALRLQPNNALAQQNLQMALHQLPPPSLPPPKNNLLPQPPPKANNRLSKQQLEQQLQQLAQQEKQLQQQMQQQKNKQMGANKDW